MPIHCSLRSRRCRRTSPTIPRGMPCALLWCRCNRPRAKHGSRPSRRAGSPAAMRQALTDRDRPMTVPQPTPAELTALAAFDTPTICNALEVVLPESRAYGYTTRPAVCGFPALKPMVEYARTARVRPKSSPALSAAEGRSLRHDYDRYVD